MRIIGGTVGGLKLDTLEGRETRPTTDRVKEAVFNILQFQIKDKKVLDLFAGSGALGLEAASRGAKFVSLVEKNKSCEPILLKNIEKTHIDTIELNIINAFDYLKTTTDSFDIIFLDPPYNKGLEVDSIEEILKNDILNLKGLIVIEKDKRNDQTYAFEQLKLLKRREYGDIEILIFGRIK